MNEVHKTNEVADVTKIKQSVAVDELMVLEEAGAHAEHTFGEIMIH